MSESWRPQNVYAAPSKRRSCRQGSVRGPWGDLPLRPISPVPWSSGSGPSHRCAKCGEYTAGIAIGGLCAKCTRLLERRASRIARLVAIGTTAVLAVYVAWTLPVERTARLVGAASVLLWYVLTFLIVKRGARERLEWSSAWDGGGVRGGARSGPGPPPQYRLADGRLLLEEPGQPLFPPELVRTAPEAQVVLDASRSRQRTEIAYVAQGMTWEALYQVIVMGARAQISGTATVTSPTLRADSAEVQLVAGAIRRTREPKEEAADRMAPMGLQAVVVRGVTAETSEEAVGETHVYQLPGRLTIEPGTPIATALFPRSSAPVTQELIVPGVLPYRGWIGQSPEPSRVPVQVWYTIKRAAKTPFGDRPLPAGTVQIYQADSSGRLQLIGEAANDHTAPGRDLRLQSGDAFDLTAERVQTDYHQEMLPPAGRGLPNRQRITAA